MLFYLPFFLKHLSEPYCYTILLWTCALDKLTPTFKPQKPTNRENSITTMIKMSTIQINCFLKKIISPISCLHFTLYFLRLLFLLFLFFCLCIKWSKIYSNCGKKINYKTLCRCNTNTNSIVLCLSWVLSTRWTHPMDFKIGNI